MENKSLADFLGIDNYKPYRNPKFEKFIEFMSCWSTMFLNMIAAMALVRWCNVWATTVILIWVSLFRIMKNNKIYFVDNKGIGPDWRESLLEDIACAVRRGVIWGVAGWLPWHIVNLLNS